jgi:hypothetical protein
MFQGSVLEFLAHRTDEPLDLVIVRVRRPGGNGLESAELLREGGKDRARDGHGLTVAPAGRAVADTVRQCEHTFPVTSQGSAYGRLRRALDRGNTLAAMSAAAELDHVGLGDALELLLLLADDQDRERFERAVIRWHARYCQQARDVTPTEGQAVLALLAMLSGPRRPQASCALAQLCDRSGMLPIAEILLRQARHPV